jgi:hypothetical protein
MGAAAAGRDPRLERGVRAILAALAAMPRAEEIVAERRRLRVAEERGYFLPDEDERVRAMWARFLSVRAVLTEALTTLEPLAGRRKRDWQESFDAFLAAFAAACLLIRGGGWVAELGTSHRVLWRKLDEAEPRYGIPRKTFTRVFRAGSSPRRLAKFTQALEFYRAHRGEAAARADDPLIGPLVELVAAVEEHLPRRRRLWLRLLLYPLFAFKRSHHSGYKKAMFGAFRVGGSAIADLHQPGVKPSGAPKRVSEEDREWLLGLLRPGDVVLSRHDDAISNWFLPGFWPHGSLFIGTEPERRDLGVDLAAGVARRVPEEPAFLEAKKDGVKFRPPEETLAVDAVVVLRLPLGPTERGEALGRAMAHEGKLYDFVFDFRKSDCLACTELIYRGFHGVGPLEFHLIEQGGRHCLPAVELAQQMLDAGAEVVALCHAGKSGRLEGEGARHRFLASIR